MKSKNTNTIAAAAVSDAQNVLAGLPGQALDDLLGSPTDVEAATFQAPAPEPAPAAPAAAAPAPVAREDVAPAANLVPEAAAPASAVGQAPVTTVAPARRPTLFDLQADWFEIILRLDAGEEIPEAELAALAAKLEQVEERIELKAEGWAKVIRQLEAEAASASAESQRLAARAARSNAMAERMTEKLKDVLIATKKDKIRTALFSFTVKSNPASVGKVDVAALPRRFLKIETVEAIDRKAILAEYREKKVAPPGVEIVSDRKHLEIR